MHLSHSRHFRIVPLIIMISVAGAWLVLLAGAQTRPTTPSPQPQTRPTPAARATPLGRTAPAPLKIQMFQPGTFPPVHPLSSGSGIGPVPAELTVAERQQIFSLTNGPLASLSLEQMVVPNKAGLRVVAPQYVGDGGIMAWPKDSGHPQTYVCLDLFAAANATYFVDVTFEARAPDVSWDIYGPDKHVADMHFTFPGPGRKIEHLTFGFANTAKSGKFLFTMAPKQEVTVYRVDVYAK